jgi:hypothetical protein
MAGAEAAAGVGVEVFVEEDEVAPGGEGEVGIVTVAGALTGAVGQEEGGECAQPGLAKRLEPEPPYPPPAHLLKQ